MSVLYHISYFSLYHLPLYTATTLSAFGHFSQKEKRGCPKEHPLDAAQKRLIHEKDLLFETLIL